MSTSIGIRVPVVVSANTSATPMQEHRAHDQPDVDVPGVDHGAETGQDDRAGGVHRHHQRPAGPGGRPARPRRARRAATAAGSAIAAAATSTGLRVCDATSSGPAAIIRPSPRLVVHDEATSQRKLRPSREGNTVSTTRGGSQEQDPTRTARVWRASDAAQAGSISGSSDLRRPRTAGGLLGDQLVVLGLQPEHQGLQLGDAAAQPMVLETQSGGGAWVAVAGSRSTPWPWVQPFQVGGRGLRAIYKSPTGSAAGSTGGGASRGAPAAGRWQLGQK